MGKGEQIMKLLLFYFSAPTVKPDCSLRSEINELLMMTSLHTEELTLWCSHNNLELNAQNSGQWTSDRILQHQPPITILNITVLTGESFRFLGIRLFQAGLEH